MLRFFKPISAADALQQQQEQLALSAARTAAAASHAVTAAALRRGPGRPRHQQDASSVLTAAASMTEEGESVEQSKTKRGKYCNWFASVYIHDILAAYRLNGRSARQAVAYLQRAFPQLPTEAAPRFADLSEATLRSWHTADGQLLPKFGTRQSTRKRAAAQKFGFQLNSQQIVMTEDSDS